MLSLLYTEVRDVPCLAICRAFILANLWILRLKTASIGIQS